MKTIVVAGDAVWDRCLVPDHARRGQVHMHPEPGGVWRLASLVRAASSDLEAQVVQCALADTVMSRYSVWALYEQTAGSKARVWRIREFLGVEPPKANAAVEIQGDTPSPDLLVLDDLGLRIREDATAWPLALQPGGNPAAIVWRTGAPLCEGQLADRLLTDFADRLTMVIPLSGLRERRAAIAQALSWDLAIEETVREFHGGVSARDLARLKRVVVSFGASGAASFAFGRLERFLYDPDELEGTWEAKRPGLMPGSEGVLAAALARHELQPGDFPLYLALGRATAAHRAQLETGGGPPERFSPEAQDRVSRDILHPAASSPEPARVFFTSVPHQLMDEAAFKEQPDGRSDLLRDVTGAGYEYVCARAAEVILRGPSAALAAAPRARYGKYFTVDREEVERINAIRNLIDAYRRNPQDQRPLSLAVFGPPGSGKSFAIKQLAAEMFAGKALVLEFNLSQFENFDDLHTAFHRVRDGSVKSQIPLVFWDEFDSAGLRWLKEFLAPMQDAEFRSKGISFPFGKAIFVFAGGTAHTFEEFDRTGTAGGDGVAFRAVKGPDFVSRLRGYVNIKGPNPIAGAGGDASLEDVAHLIRRAIIFRSCLERFCPQVIDATGTAAVAAGVVNAFLRVRAYLHGARSLESLVNMSRLSGAYFGSADLPSPDLLRLHATPDFLEHAQTGQLESPVIEALAAEAHESWRRQRQKEGWSYGQSRDETARTHPLLRPYRELAENEKELSRITARVTAAKLTSLGLRIVPCTSVSASAPRELTEEEYTKMMRVEHDIWLRGRLLSGYQYAECSNDRLRLHRDILPFDQVPEEDRELDRALAQSVVATLWRQGYVLVALG